jgi:hypothetical protein
MDLSSLPFNTGFLIENKFDSTCVYDQSKKFETEVFWVVTPCGVVVGHQRYSPWRWRQHGPLKHWYSITKLHDVMTQNTSTWKVTAVKTSEVAKPRNFCYIRTLYCYWGVCISRGLSSFLLVLFLSPVVHWRFLSIFFCQLSELNLYYFNNKC